MLKINFNCNNNFLCFCVDENDKVMGMKEESGNLV